MKHTLLDFSNIPLELRVAGFWQGQAKISDDFDETSEEVITAFYGEDE